MTVPRFIVMTSSAQGARRKGVYRNVAVVETDGTMRPDRIDIRCKHVVRIVKHYGPQHVGRTEACQFRRTMKEAETLAAKMNVAFEASAENDICE